jgi:hypothetical protein
MQTRHQSSTPLHALSGTVVSTLNPSGSSSTTLCVLTGRQAMNSVEAQQGLVYVLTSRQAHELPRLSVLLYPKIVI